MSKTYRTQFGIGKARYVISYHDGQKLHKDGSPFFDMRIFRDARSRLKFINELIAQGYRAR